MGVGQSYEVELYDPLTHTSEGLASLDTKRAMLSALALDDGRAIIAGNWYHKDGIEIYDGKVSFLPVKGVSIGRCSPHILQTAKDNAIIIGGMDTVGHHITFPVADRLQGEPCHVPLLEEWAIAPVYLPWPSSTAFIGDKTQGDYSYLLLISNDEGQLAIARVTNGEFTLLPTDVPIPRSSQGEEIFYFGHILVDRQCQRAYLIGFNTDSTSPSDTNRVYVLAIDYAMSPARLTLCYTDVLTDVYIDNFILTADGDLMLTGGIPQGTNFKPTATTWLIHTSPRSQAIGISKFFSILPPWGWLLISLAIMALCAIFILLAHRRRRNHPQEPVAAVHEQGPAITQEAPATEYHEDIDGQENYAELMRRICQLMEKERLYLNPTLKMTDIAVALGTSRTSISNCINSQRGCSFPQFVNTYRVAHAQALLCNQPDCKIAEVSMSSGFSSEASFYRIFKSITGTTPTDWRQDNKE